MKIKAHRQTLPTRKSNNCFALGSVEKEMWGLKFVDDEEENYIQTTDVSVESMQADFDTTKWREVYEDEMERIQNVRVFKHRQNNTTKPVQ